MTAVTMPGSVEPFTAAHLAGLPRDDGRRYELVDGSLLVHRDEPFTVDDVEAWPDDGRRHEVVDGVLVITPAPSIAHQRMLVGLLVALRASCPADLEVVVGAGYRADRATQFVPDLFVCRRRDAVGRYLTVAPLLAVEIASPSTAGIDRGRKREAYEARGVASYWLPDPLRPSIAVLELRGGRYEELASVAGREVLLVERPFPVRLVPAELAAG